MSGVTNGGVSFWWSQLGIPEPRPSLTGSVTADVCIVGAGYTGLWAAYYVKRNHPDARVVVLEQRFAGFGASGRNGGWMMNAITGGREKYARTHGRQAAIDLQQAMNETVDEIIAVSKTEGIEADIRKGGELGVAYLPSQVARLDRAFQSESAWPNTNVERWSGPETAERIAVDGVMAGLWHPHCARVHPAKLARGLAKVVESLGVKIYEGTRVDEITPGAARTAAGTVSAPIVIRATEGFTPQLRQYHREVLPMNSSLIVTKPLGPAFWDGVGWHDGTVLGDYANVYMYAQRTADDRIAFGGRGVPYRYGSRIDDDGATQESTIASLSTLLRRFFPAAREAEIDHAWAGVLGVPRDWSASVGLDRDTGIGWAGGYVGTGVAATNLAGRTLADLVTGKQTSLTRLPWVGHRARRWEVEPLRWLAVTGIYAAYSRADAQEMSSRSASTPLIARIADLVAGR